MEKEHRELVTIVDMATGIKIPLSSERVFELALKLLEVYSKDEVTEITLYKELFMNSNKKHISV